MTVEPRTLFVNINDANLKISEPDSLLFHDQWFLREKFTDQNLARRFLDQHVRGYYKDSAIYFYRCPTFIYDDRDIEVMLKFLDPLLEKLKARAEVSPGQQLDLYAGRGLNAQLIKSLTI